MRSDQARDDKGRFIKGASISGPGGAGAGLEIRARLSSRQLARAFQRMGPELTQLLRQVVSRNAQIMRNLIQIKIQRGPKSGRLYEFQVTTDRNDSSLVVGWQRFPNGKLLPVRKRDKPHRASAPLEPPATDSGFLASSVQYTVRGFSAEVGYTARYGPFLEYGTRYMKKRPAVKPVFDERKRVFQDEARAAVLAAMRAGEA